MLPQSILSGLVIHEKYQDVHSRGRGGSSGLLQLLILSIVEDEGRNLHEEYLNFKVWGTTASNKFRHCISSGSTVVIGEESRRELTKAEEMSGIGGGKLSRVVVGSLLAVSIINTDELEFVENHPALMGLRDTIWLSAKSLWRKIDQIRQWKLLRSCQCTPVSKATIHGIWRDGKAHIFNIHVRLSLASVLRSDALTVYDREGDSTKLMFQSPQHQISMLTKIFSRVTTLIPRLQSVTNWILSILVNGHNSDPAVLSRALAERLSVHDNQGSPFIAKVDTEEKGLENVGDQASSAPDYEIPVVLTNIAVRSSFQKRITALRVLPCSTIELDETYTYAQKHDPNKTSKSDTNDLSRLPLDANAPEIVKEVYIETPEVTYLSPRRLLERLNSEHLQGVDAFSLDGYVLFCGTLRQIGFHSLQRESFAHNLQLSRCSGHSITTAETQELVYREVMMHVNAEDCPKQIVRGSNGNSADGKSALPWQTLYEKFFLGHQQQQSASVILPQEDACCWLPTQHPLTLLSLPPTSMTAPDDVHDDRGNVGNTSTDTGEALLKSINLLLDRQRNRRRGHQHQHVRPKDILYALLQEALRVKNVDLLETPAQNRQAYEVHGDNPGAKQSHTPKKQLTSTSSCFTPQYKKDAPAITTSHTDIHDCSTYVSPAPPPPSTSWAVASTLIEVVDSSFEITPQRSSPHHQTLGEASSSCLHTANSGMIQETMDTHIPTGSRNDLKPDEHHPADGRYNSPLPHTVMTSDPEGEFQAQSLKRKLDDSFASDEHDVAYHSSCGPYAVDYSSLNLINAKDARNERLSKQNGDEHVLPVVIPHETLQRLFLDIPAPLAAYSSLQPQHRDHAEEIGRHDYAGICLHRMKALQLLCDSSTTSLSPHAPRFLFIARILPVATPEDSDDFQDSNGEDRDRAGNDALFSERRILVLEDIL